MPRSSWKGYVRLSLVSVPVQALNAALPGGGEIHLHQLHAECNNRIRYQKVCPVHGEVAATDIVMGYEYAKGKYVIVEPDELDKLRTDADRAINIDTFVPPDEIDPLYFDGRTYYLIPDGPVAHKPYAVLQQAMREAGKFAIGNAVFNGKEQLVLVRAIENVLSLSMLKNAEEVRLPITMTDDVGEVVVSKEELRLAHTLIDASTADQFDLTQYKDLYTQRMTKLIESKIAGEEVVAQPHDEQPGIINLMDALRKSVAASKSKSRSAKSTNGKSARPKHKLAPSRRKKVASLRRKSS